MKVFLHEIVIETASAANYHGNLFVLFIENDTAFFRKKA